MLPTPLYACPVQQDWTEICDAPPDCERTIIGSTIGENHRANAARLVQIINAHEQLLETCRRVLESLTRSLAEDYLPETRDALRAAIATATGSGTTPTTDKITVGVWVSGGVVQSARASRPDVALKVYDQDEMECASDGTEDAASDEYEAIPHAIY